MRTFALPFKNTKEHMSTKKRILFIANEMSPYLELTEFAEIVNKLAVKSNDSGMEVRCIMPRFGVINERRHRLHEVVRLSGINVSIDDLLLQERTRDCKKIRLAARHHSLQRLDGRIDTNVHQTCL